MPRANATAHHCITLSVARWLQTIAGTGRCAKATSCGEVGGRSTCLAASSTFWQSEAMCFSIPSALPGITMLQYLHACNARREGASQLLLSFPIPCLPRHHNAAVAACMRGALVKVVCVQSCHQAFGRRDSPVEGRRDACKGKATVVKSPSWAWKSMCHDPCFGGCPRQFSNPVTGGMQ